MRLLVKLGIIVFSVAWAAGSWSYPLDGYPYTGILRLEGFRLAQQGKVQGIHVPSGALLDSAQVDLRMQDQKEFQIPAVDPDLAAKVEKLLGEEAARYGLA